LLFVDFSPEISLSPTKPLPEAFRIWWHWLGG
jgi:hypothetical protein